MKIRTFDLNGTSLVLRLMALGAVVGMFVANGAQASIRWATLEAIHQLENPCDRSTPGPFGELGPYQFREATWQMHTATPFARALDRSASDQVAVKHYEWIKERLLRAGFAATPYNIALAWNGGLNAVVNGNAPAVARDYAERAANLTSALNVAVVAADH